MFTKGNFDFLDLILVLFGAVILLTYIVAYFQGLPADNNLTKWFLTILGVFIAKKAPSTIGK